MGQPQTEGDDIRQREKRESFWLLRLSRTQIHVFYGVWILLSCAIAKGTLDIAESNWKYLVLLLPAAFAVAYIWYVFVRRNYRWPGQPLGI